MIYQKNELDAIVQIFIGPFPDQLPRYLEYLNLENRPKFYLILLNEPLDSLARLGDKQLDELIMKRVFEPLKQIYINLEEAQETSSLSSPFMIRAKNYTKNRKIL